MHTSIFPSLPPCKLIMIDLANTSNGIINHPQDQTEIDPQFDLSSFMIEKATSINEALEKAVFRQPKSSLNCSSPDRIMEAVRYSLLAGGKRIKSVLCIAACELVGGLQFAAMPAVVAIEMVHTMSLIQNDLPCMDNDDFRRGQPSNHKMFGEDVAILASDTLIFSAIQRSIKEVGPDRVLRCVSELAKAAGVDGLVGSQAADLCIQENDHDHDHDLITLDLNQHLEFIHTHKTGVLIQSAVAVGAILGGGSDEQVEKLRKYAYCIGLMFQIVDVTKSCEKLGKTAGKDVSGDKITYPKVVEIERSRELVDKLVMKALEQLAEFDQQKAAPLIALVTYLAL